MKKHDNNFKDFVCLLTSLGIASSFSEKKNTDKTKTETNKIEKNCRCGNNCESHQEFCKKLLKEFLNFKKMMFEDDLNRTDAFAIYGILCDIERLLRTEAEKADTKKPLTADKIAEKTRNLFEYCTKCKIKEEIDGYTEIVCGGYLE